MLSVSRLFPILAIIVAFLAYSDPSPLISWKSAIIPLLAMIMFCMGLTLRLADFKRVWNNPQPIKLFTEGVLFRYEHQQAGRFRQFLFRYGLGRPIQLGA